MGVDYVVIGFDMEVNRYIVNFVICIFAALHNGSHHLSSEFFSGRVVPVSDGLCCSPFTEVKVVSFENIGSHYLEPQGTL